MPGSHEPVVTEPSSEPVKDDISSATNGVGENGKAEKGASGDEKVKTPSKEDYESGPGLLAQGKRHLYVKDYPSAVTTLGDACAKLSATHGELSDECADGYYYYGCALLELAREEMGVLGEPENKEESDASNDEEEGEEEEEEPQEESSKVDGEEKEETGKEGKGDDKIDEDEKKEGEDKEKESEDKEKESEDKEKEVEDADKVGEEDEDVNNLQLAWEMFDLARVIYERQNADKKLAETFLKLGEVAMESENYDSAVDDMNKCLTIQQKMLASDNRAIAETLFQLGVASSLCNQFNEAIKYFTNAGVVLERRIRNLTSTKNPDPENLRKNPFYTIEKEVEELRALLPEIKDKIADMEDFKSESLKALKENLTNLRKDESDAGPSSSTANGSSSSSADPAPISASPSKAPAKDISHLIRKKRKADDAADSEKDKSESKKPNVESSS